MPPTVADGHTSDSSTKSSIEARIQGAIAGLKSGLHKNINTAAKECRVKYTTLRNRYLGLNLSSKASHEKQQLLTNVQTAVLIDWCKHQANQGTPYTRLDLAQQVFQLSGKMPGKRWINRFLKNSSGELEAGRAQGLDPKRAKAFNPTTVSNHFTLLGQTLEKYNIPPENIYNEDEKGLQLGGGRKGLPVQFIFAKGAKMRTVLRSDSLVLVTVLEAVCADGTLVPPVLVLPKGETGEWWTAQGIGAVATSDNGWTDNEIYRMWLTSVFIPHAQVHNTSGGWILLITDGHASHETPELQALAFEHRIILYSLPPHTTHKLQPLDVGVFGPLQNAWARRCQVATTELQTVTRATVVKEYMDVRNKSVTAKLVQAAFRHCGIHPFNPTIFTDEDFAPSQASSTHIGAPSTYPERVPSSPESARMTCDEDTPEDTPEEDATGDDEDMDPDELSDDDSDYMEEDSEVEVVGDTFVNLDDDIAMEGSSTEPSSLPGPEAAMIGATMPAITTAAGLSLRTTWPSPPPSNPPASSTAGGGSIGGTVRSGSSSRGSRGSHSYGTRSYTRDMLQPRVSSAAQSNSSLHSSSKGSLNNLRSYEDELEYLRLENQDLRRRLDEETLRRQLAESERNTANALRAAAEAHATIRTMEAESLRRQLHAKTEGKKRRVVHTEARLLTAPEAEAAWREQEASRLKHAEEEATKKSEKEAALRLRELQRAHNAVLKTFDAPLSSYKRKDDLKDIAAALALDSAGTISELQTRIKGHLDATPSLADNPRFSGLLQAARRSRKRPLPDDGAESGSNSQPIASSSGSAPALLEGGIGL